MTHTSQVVFYRKEDALLAKKHLNGYVLFGSKIIVTFPLSSITGTILHYFYIVLTLYP